MRTLDSRRSVLLAYGVAAVLAQVAPGALAQNYTVNVNPKLNGLDIKIEPVAQSGMLVVNLTNNSSQKVRCDLNYQADPQVPYRDFAVIEPGKRESSVLRAKQRWFEVDVDVDCRPVDKK
jgi:hypothetical protein